jgi:hypothetical protein
MSRIKLKYSESEISNNLYTFGDEFMTPDKQEYKGLYHRYLITNETYTGATWNESTSKPLRPLIKESELVAAYNTIKKQSTTKFDAIVPVQITITPQDATNGYIYRYFLKKSNELVYIEIDQKQYSAYQRRLDTNLYVASACKWYIAGPKETQSQPVLIPGVVELNTKAITELQIKLPGISQKLTNPLEFYTDTDFVVPRDINLG